MERGGAMERGVRLEDVLQGCVATVVAHFSRPSPQIAILLLSADQAMSLILPLMGWYSYLSRCSFCVVSQIRIFPEKSGEESEGKIHHSDD